MKRRAFFAFLAVATIGFVTTGRAETADEAFAAKVTAIETKLGARLGLAILDTESGTRWNHRADEIFPLCSTFKALAAAAVLARADAGEETLERRIKFESTDLVTHSPITRDHTGGDGLSLAELCAAAITQSDNTAANLILKSLGGPSGITRFARSLGDEKTRLDRWETELNEASPGDPRDTTTPAAMTANLHKLIASDHLSKKSRDHLIQWLIANTTGDAKFRAGLPKDWRIGDKTGSGAYGTMNDIAVIWPPNRKPIFISVYITETTASDVDRNAAFAAIARELPSLIR